MLHQIPTSISSRNTLPTPYTLLLGKRLDIVIYQATRAVYEKYREKRREERHLFRRKKHEFVKADCEEIEIHGSRNDARKFLSVCLKVLSLKLLSARTKMVIW